MATIAIVDDDEDIGLLLKTFLEEKGFKVWRALDLNQFFGLIRGNKPDLVIMDIQMPGGSGITAIKKLRQDPETQELPVIIMSAMPMDLQKQWVADCSAHVRHLQKPVEFKDLMKEITDALGSPGQDPGLA